MSRYGDEQCWHYHHPPASGIGNEWGLDWTRLREYEQIVSRQILEREWFPSCFRAGGTILDRHLVALGRRVVSVRLLEPGAAEPSRPRRLVQRRRRLDGSITRIRRTSVVQAAGRRRMARCLDLAHGSTS